LPDGTIPREGDLLFRRGTSPASRLVLELERSSGYSHVGILTAADGDFAVLHVSVGEEEPAPDRVRQDPLPAFLAPDRAAAWALLRLREGADRAGPLAVAAARRYLEARTAFDPALDLEDDRRLYCTELVWRAYREAGVDLAPGPLETFPIVGGGRGVLSVGRLADSPLLHVVASSPSTPRTLVPAHGGHP
jgi:hypothetical protein